MFLVLFSKKYFIVLVNVMYPSGEINTGLQDLKARALRAYYSLKGKIGHYFMSYPSTTLHLFDTLIKPILLYNSDY